MVRNLVDLNDLPKKKKKKEEIESLVDWDFYGVLISHVPSQATGSPMGAVLTVFWVVYFHQTRKTKRTCRACREDVDALGDPLTALFQGSRGIW